VLFFPKKGKNMKTPPLRFRTVLLTVFILPVFAAYVLLNSFFLMVGDILGVYRRLALRRIKSSYGWEPSDAGSHVSAPWSDYVLRRAGEISLKLGPQGWSAEAGARTVVLTQGSFGMCVPHKSARDQRSRRAKRLYYLQGSHFEMGYLLGLMAEKDVARMTVDYVDNVIFDFAGDKGKHPFLGTLIADLVYRLAVSAKAHLPKEMTAELYGIYAGCITANPDTRVLMRDLLDLNYGIDIILSLVYAGAEPILKIFGVDVARWKNPAACNGFVVTGKAAGGGAFMGRDFMFPTCNEFGDTCAPILYFSDGRLSPKDGPGPSLQSARAGAEGAGFWKEIPRAPLPCLVFASPGMVGAVTAMNRYGVAMGVDMVNGRNCKWRDVGINSLLMVRRTIQRSRSAKRAVDSVRAAKRGVTWLYLIGDGGSGQGVVVEAGASGRDRNPLRYAPRELRKSGLLPTRDFLKQNPAGSRFSNGMGERWPGWRLSGKWLESETTGAVVPWGRFNESLFRRFHMPLMKGKWGPRDVFGVDQHDRVVPNPYYFAPQRECRDDLIVVTNHFLLPEMRLLAMNEWTAHFAAAKDSYDDFQWRYDVLNRGILTELEKNGALTLDSARNLIDFLRPYEPDGAPAANHNYYGVYRDRVSRPTEVPIGGVVSVFDLKELRMKAHYGWYADEWVEVDFKSFA
jgi:hypothetical protein